MFRSRSARSSTTLQTKVEAVGNLPFSATKEAVTKHFAAVRPKSVRVLTHKEDPSKCKGFAFLEFGKYDTMKSCLEKFHHSPFEDGVSEARKLNVELTFVPQSIPGQCTRAEIAFIELAVGVKAGLEQRS